MIIDAERVVLPNLVWILTNFSSYFAQQLE